MADDIVDVTIRGEKAFPVHRAHLASTMQEYNRIARNWGKRPGEPIGALPPNEKLSADVLSTMLVVIREIRKKNSGF
jgi:hypothetical protein